MPHRDALDTLSEWEVRQVRSYRRIDIDQPVIGMGNGTNSGGR